MPDYRAQTTDADALGIAIANWAEWDGSAILELAGSALEDANFHKEAGIVRLMLEEVMAA